MRSAASLIVALVAGGCTQLTIGGALQPGVALPTVHAAADPGQDYAIYLPSGYSKAKRWPIVFGFSPSGRGLDVVERLRGAAEKHGWIVLASNQAHNGPNGPIAVAERAMWQDATKYLAVHPLRMYAVGFSGGARMAIDFAARHAPHFAGVIAAGAFLSPDDLLPLGGRLAFYLLVGDRDPNLGEAHGAAGVLAARHAVFWLDERADDHRWPGAPDFERAVGFFEELAHPDPARRAAFLAERLAHAAADDTAGAPLLALAGYQMIARFAPDSEAGTRAAAEAEKIAARPEIPELVRAADALDGFALRDLAGTTAALDAAEKWSRPAGPLKERAQHLLEVIPELAIEHAVDLARGKDKAAEAWLHVGEAHIQASGADPSTSYYNAGCAWSLLGKPELAHAALERAVAHGFSDATQLARDPDLADYRESHLYPGLAARLGASSSGSE